MVRTKIEQYIFKWEDRCYPNGIPDQAPAEIADKVPNWKSIALCILKNDLHLTGIGFKAPKSKYYSILKKIEIDARDYD